VYGLGVLLYELLTGRTPHVCLANDRDVSVNELCRRIKGEEPPKPSQVISELDDETRAYVAAKRNIDATKLAALYRGDLDCLVMKALRRDPQERYESVLALARDVDHFVANEPIEARKPSLVYRARKFSRRQRVPLAAIATMTVALLLAATVVGVNWYRQRTEQATRNSLNREKIEIALDETGRLHEQALVAGDHDLQSITKALEVARRAEALLEMSEGNADLEQRVRGYLSRITAEEKDRRFLTSIEGARIHAVGEDPTDQQRSEVALRDAFAALDITIGSGDARGVAEKLIACSVEVQDKAVAALDIWAAIHCQDSPALRSWLYDVVNLSDSDPWRIRLRAAVNRLDKSALERLADSAELDEQSPSCFIALVHALQRVRSRAYLDVLHGATDAYPNVLYFNTVLGNLYSRQASKYDADATQKAIRYLSAALALRPSEPRILNNLGMNLSRSGDHGQAVSLLRRATKTQPDFWYSWHNLSLTLTKKGDFAAAAQTYGESLKRLHLVPKQLPVDDLLRRTLDSLQDAHELATLPNVLAANQWQYSHSKPQNWPSSGDADAQWRIGSASFGTAYFHPRTEWNSSELWLRTAFSLPDMDTSESLVFVIRAVARVRIHLNGQLVADQRIANDEPYCIRMDRTDITSLRDGENRLTVHAKAIHRQRRVEVALHVGDRFHARQQCDKQLLQVVQHLQEVEARESSSDRKSVV
jgi:tetratricopeptide (TPR) repeat protein